MRFGWMPHALRAKLHVSRVLHAEYAEAFLAGYALKARVALHVGPAAIYHQVGRAAMKVPGVHRPGDDGTRSGTSLCEELCLAFRRPHSLHHGHLVSVLGTHARYHA